LHGTASRQSSSPQTPPEFLGARLALYERLEQVADVPGEHDAETEHERVPAGPGGIAQRVLISACDTSRSAATSRGCMTVAGGLLTLDCVWHWLNDTRHDIDELPVDSH